MKMRFRERVSPVSEQKPRRRLILNSCTLSTRQSAATHQMPIKFGRIFNMFIDWIVWFFATDEFASVAPALCILIGCCMRSLKKRGAWGYIKVLLSRATFCNTQVERWNMTPDSVNKPINKFKLSAAGAETSF